MENTGPNSSSVTRPWTYRHPWSKSPPPWMRRSRRQDPSDRTGHSGREGWVASDGVFAAGHGVLSVDRRAHIMGGRKATCAAASLARSPCAPRDHRPQRPTEGISASGEPHLPALAATEPTQVLSLDGDSWRIAVDPTNVGRQEEWFNAPRPEAKATRVPWIIQDVFPDYHGVAWYWRDFVHHPIHIRTVVTFSDLRPWTTWLRCTSMAR